jgi:hypothetical protein
MDVEELAKPTLVYEGPEFLNLATELLTVEQLRQRVKESPGDVVDTIIPASSVNIAVGDSGIGKTPLFYLLGLSVATGKPFLGYPTKQGRVMMLDYENSHENQIRLTEALTQFLGIEDSPENFRVVTPGERYEIDAKVEEFKPSLLIIDSLRMYDSRAESENSYAGDMLRRRSDVAKANGTSFLIIHHVKKPNPEYRKKLLKTPTLDWLQEASGARALINQTDVRIALDGGRGEEPLILRGYSKLKGEFGPLSLERVANDHGEPIGYRRLQGLKLLDNEEQMGKYQEFPNEFTFKEAKLTYGRGDQATRDFLRKAIEFGLLEQVSRGLYRKTGGGGEVAE